MDYKEFKKAVSESYSKVFPKGQIAVFIWTGDKKKKIVLRPSVGKDMEKDVMQVYGYIDVPFAWRESQDIPSKSSVSYGYSYYGVNNIKFGKRYFDMEKASGNFSEISRRLAINFKSMRRQMVNHGAI